jgi:hypothetical protein
MHKRRKPSKLKKGLPQSDHPLPTIHIERSQWVLMRWAAAAFMAAAGVAYLLGHLGPSAAIAG